MKPMKVQLAALSRSNGAAGFAYFMEMGLGKTLTAGLDLIERVAEGNATRSIVVCPNSFKTGWVDDFIKHDLSVNQFVYNSDSNSHEQWLRQPTNQVRQLILNYEAIRTEKTQRFLQEYMQGHKVFGIFDESIQLKTHDSLQTKAAINVAKDLAYSRILSGKPITQGPHDLWGQFRVIKQFNGRNYFAFKTAFCKMGGFKMKQVLGAQNEDILSELIDPYTFRATKAEWTDLPPKIFHIRDYVLTPAMKSMYKQMADEFVLWLQNGDLVTVDAAITKYIKLAQIQCGWVYKEDKSIVQLVEDKDNPRLNLLCEVLNNEVIGKSCVVYHHKPVFEQLTRRLVNENPAWIKGGMTQDEIAEQKRKFNEDPSCRVILLQDNASKYGHTLLGDQNNVINACSTMIFYENNYSLDTRSQIEDRSHRHGQLQSSVNYIDLIGTPIDRDCIKALQRKESVFQAVFAGMSSH
jgi:SNF2 family DNA or RNA helicase